MNTETLVSFEAIKWLGNVLVAIIFIPIFLVILLIGYFVPQEE